MWNYEKRLQYPVNSRRGTEKSFFLHVYMDALIIAYPSSFAYVCLPRHNQVLKSGKFLVISTRKGAGNRSGKGTAKKQEKEGY